MAFRASEASVHTPRSRGLGSILNLAVLSAILPLAACIAHAPGSGQQQRISVTVTATPASPASVPVSTSTASTVQLTATVTGTSNTAVTWSLAAASNASTLCTATGSGLGTISGTGNSVTYTAPTSVPVSPCGVAITATSSEDNTTTGQALVNVHVLVTITPASDNIGQGANLQYTATVTGAPSSDQGVIWSASCPNCGSQQSGGAFDANNPGLFIAPGLVQGTTQVVTTINATSNFDPTQTGAATITVLPNDPLGTVSPTSAAAAEITCPTFSAGLAGSTCYQLTVSCDQIADWTTYLKVNTPPSGTTLLGTVIFETGRGGTSLYDNNSDFMNTINGQPFNGGDTVVQGILNLGYTTVQLSFGDAPFDNGTGQANGWLQGPGGVRRLACRYATVADWVYKNIHNSTTLPYCATGNSGGSGAVGYAATTYALASEFSLLEVTSGPVMTRLHQGCNVCGNFLGSDPCTEMQENMCYSASGGTDGTAAIIDTAYQAVGQMTPTLCTDAVNGVVVGGVTDPNFNRFQSDSIEWESGGNSTPLPIPDPPTDVSVVFGTLDTSNAIPQGDAWWSGVSPQPSKAVCVPDAEHAIPAVQDGAAQIISDIQSKCVVQ